MFNIRKKMLLGVVLCALASPSYACDTHDFMTQINMFYKEKAALLSADKIDIEKAVEEAKQQNVENAVFKNSIKNARTGRIAKVSMTKEDMIKKIPEAYAKTRENKTTINVTDMMIDADKKHATVTYDMRYQAVIEDTDIYGRDVSMDMSMTASCEERIVRQDDGLIQTISGECDAEVTQGEREVSFDGDAPDAGPKTPEEKSVN